jgi:hypothetical protein
VDGGEADAREQVAGRSKGDAAQSRQSAVVDVNGSRQSRMDAGEQRLASWTVGVFLDTLGGREATRREAVGDFADRECEKAGAGICASVCLAASLNVPGRGVQDARECLRGSTTMQLKTDESGGSAMETMDGRQRQRSRTTTQTLGARCVSSDGCLSAESQLS